MNDCEKWKENLDINPKTGREIKKDGPAFNKLRRECASKSPKTMRRLRSALSKEDKCEKWLANETVNPVTNRQIKINGPVYKNLKKECASEALKRRRVRTSSFSSSASGSSESTEFVTAKSDLSSSTWVTPKSLSPKASKCEKWLANETVNPVTNRQIKINGPVYKNLKKECASEALKRRRVRTSSFSSSASGSSESTEFVTAKSDLSSSTWVTPKSLSPKASKCEKWLANETVNPVTNRQIKINGPVYTKLKKKCTQKSPARVILKSRYGDGSPSKFSPMEVHAAMMKAALDGNIGRMAVLRGLGAVNYDLYLDPAAREGRINAMLLLKTWGATEFNRALASAAAGGQLDAITVLADWGATDFNWALAEAASEGRIEAMHMLKDLGATNFDWALGEAAAGGHLVAMRLLKWWTADEYDWALAKAAYKGQLDAMNLLLDWGASNYDDALSTATAGGHSDAMMILKDAGATDFDAALRIGAVGGHKEALTLLLDWGATTYDDALVNAAGENRLKAMKLLKKRGAKDFNRALINASVTGSTDAMKLLKKWGTSEYDKALDGALKYGRTGAVKLLRKWIS